MLSVSLQCHPSDYVLQHPVPEDAVVNNALHSAEEPKSMPQLLPMPLALGNLTDASNVAEVRPAAQSTASLPAGEAATRTNRNPQIIDLNNVPLVSGTSYVKWHLPSSTSAEHRGHTAKAVIRDHKVTWDYGKTLPVRLTVDRTGMLQESEIHFEVLQEYSPSTRAERIVLGNVKLNLSEFVGGSDEGEEAVMRRYLMQESKINSTLKASGYTSWDG